MNYDVIIVGAGVAGLAAASELVQTGMKVLCLEATGRLGGRIFTLHNPGVELPLELGAEFIHGRPPETWDLVRESNLTVFQHNTQAVHIGKGRVVGREENGKPAGDVLSRLSSEGKDRTLRKSLEHSRRPHAEKEWAIAHIEGFNAAREERVSIAALKEEADAADAIDGDCIFRLVHGYDSVLAALIPAPDQRILRHHVVERVQWRPHQVRLSVHSTLDGKRKSFVTSRLIVTVPLGVLRAEIGETGAIDFDPPPAKILAAARQLEFGHVFRVVFRFRDPFWKEAAHLKNAAFLVSRENVFPTWWTCDPIVAPLLTGWSAGPAADTLRGRPEGEVIQEALASLSRILAMDVPAPVSAHFHNWSADPFFRGAYSYVPVNGLHARSALARPVEDTLFFAGEASNIEGHGATVHGAIATGRRAARQVQLAIGSMRRATR